MRHGGHQRILVWLRSLGQAAEGLDDGTHCSPVHRLAIFAFFQDVLASTVIGVLIEYPVAVQDLAGLHLSQAVTLQNGGAILGGLKRLTCKVCLVVELHLVLGPGFLE